MRALISLLLVLSMSGCGLLSWKEDEPVPVITVTLTNADAELIALALTPPLYDLPKEEALDAPVFEVYHDKETDRVVYVMTEANALKLIDYIVATNASIEVRNKLIYLLRSHATDMKLSAERASKKVAN